MIEWKAPEKEPCFEASMEPVSLTFEIEGAMALLLKVKRSYWLQFARSLV